MALTASIALGDFTHEVIAEHALPLPHEHRVDTTLDRAALDDAIEGQAFTACTSPKTFGNLKDGLGLLLDLGDMIESLDGRYRTAEDVGTTEHDMLVVRERTAHVVGLPAENGGAGEPAHFAPAVGAGADAVLAASIFHSGQCTIGEVKAAMRAAGVTVR